LEPDPRQRIAQLASPFFLLTIFVPSILIGSFHVSRTTISGIIIPAMEINKFFAFCVIAAFISMLTHFIEWLTE
jgi:hypothetical protein